ncbi:MAG: hypothetical protein ABI995_10675, partial [Acidobacteriota bacterium]
MMGIFGPPDPTPSPSDSVLLDNSTYFSAMIALREAVLDSRSVFNLATLLEAIVLKEGTFFSPTSVWKPGPEDDLLFGPERPCHSLGLSSFPSATLRALFKGALEFSLADATNEALRLHTPHGLDAPDINGTRHILLEWIAELDRDLDQFRFVRR